MQQIEQLFQKYPTYYVGGYVRDWLLGRESPDIDIVVDAPLSEWLPMFQKVVKPYVMLRYESCSFKWEGCHYTISRMRKDVSCDGRQADIEPVHTIEEDALRRDFTINAIYMTYDRKIIDPVGGVEDLKNKIVRFIGDVEVRVKEDQLRILRYFRFCALLGVMPEPGMIQVFEKYGPIITVSKERIQEEWRKLLKWNPSGKFLKQVERFYGISG